MLKVKLKLFGIFRDYLGDVIDLKFEKKINLKNFKEYIRSEFLVNDLHFLSVILDKSFFSNKDIILSYNYNINDGDVIFLLPPFSGG